MGPLKRKDGTTYYADCQIVRVVKITSLNPLTWDETSWRWEIKPCGTPLFGNRANVGICKSCSNGWEVPDSQFASSDEKAKALGNQLITAP